MISIIVAIAQNFAIGKNNELLWHIPNDLKRFKKITHGHAVIMGKKTYESLPMKPLPDRQNIVITDNPQDLFPGCTKVHSIEEALAQIKPEDETFIIGGASVYQQFLPYTNRLYLTIVHKDFDGDVFFPEIDLKEWQLLTQEDCPFNELTGFSYSYHTYQRRKIV
jgi:dihydrofolate reductase